MGRYRGRQDMSETNCNIIGLKQGELSYVN